MKLRFLALSLVLAALFALSASGSGAPLSPGLEVIRSDIRLVKCCVNGESVTFNEAEFSELIGGKLSYITVTGLPKLSDGVLKLAGVDVIPGQSISAAGLRFLKFMPSRGFNAQANFCFSVAADGWESETLQCVIRFSESANFAPVAVGLTLSTYENVSVRANLGTYDPDGDPLEYVLCNYPKSGAVSISAEGIASYTPSAGFRGADSFSFYAVDCWGNKSKTALAEVNVVKNKSGIYFADMRDSDAHLAAIKTAEREVMTYTLIGDSYYFSPLEKVSRIDFTVMLVSAAGTELPKKQYPTDIFTDTAALSDAKKLYLEAAVTEGLIKAEAGGFRPDEPITVYDALRMTENALKDGDKMIGAAYFGREEQTLTKEEAAVLLCAVIK